MTPIFSSRCDPNIFLTNQHLFVNCGEPTPSLVTFPGVLNAFPPSKVQKAAQVCSPDVGFCAGPWVVPLLFFETGSDRVLFKIAKSVHEVGFIHCTGEVPVLPQVATLIMQTVEELGVTEVGSPDGFLEAFSFFRYANDVNMIAHEAEANNMNPIPLAFLFQESKVGSTVLIGEEDVLFVVSPLGNVMRFTGDYDSCCPCHVFTLYNVPPHVNN